MQGRGSGGGSGASRYAFAMRPFRRRTQPTHSPTAAGPRASAQANDADWRRYDSIADDYGRTLAPRLALAARDLVDMMGLSPGGRVLDVGTGTGAAARAAASFIGPGESVVGVDISLNMLLVAAREGGGPRYVAGSAIDLPFRDGAFSHTLANFVLSHFTSFDTALFDMMRVTRPGGRVGVTNWGGDDQDEFSKAWLEVAEQFVQAELLQDASARAAPWEERFGDPGVLEEALHDAGLRNLRLERRQYRFEMTIEEHLAGRAVAGRGRFLRQMLGDELWRVFQTRVREVFAARFPARFSDFRDVILAVGTKPS